MPVEVAFGERRVVPRVSVASTWSGSRAAASSSPAAAPRPSSSQCRTRPCASAPGRCAERDVVAVGSTSKTQPVFVEILRFSVVTPQRAPGLAVGHHGASAGAPHLQVEGPPRLLCRERRPLDAPCGDLAADARASSRPPRPTRPLMRRVHVEACIARPWATKCCSAKSIAPNRCGSSVLMPASDGSAAASISRGDLRVLASPRRPPPRSTAPRCQRTVRVCTSSGKQHFGLQASVTVLEVIDLAGALRRYGEARPLYAAERARRCRRCCCGDV